MLYYLAIFAYILFCWICLPNRGSTKGKATSFIGAFFCYFGSQQDGVTKREPTILPTTSSIARQRHWAKPSKRAESLRIWVRPISAIMLLNSLFRTIGTDINIMFFLIAFVTNLLLFGSIGQIFAPVPISLYSGLLYVLLLHARYERDQAIDRRLYLHLLATLYPATANRPLCGDHSDCGAVSPFCVVVLPLYWIGQPEVPSWLLHTTTRLGSRSLPYEYRCRNTRAETHRSDTALGGSRLQVGCLHVGRGYKCRGAQLPSCCFIWQVMFISSDDESCWTV